MKKILHVTQYFHSEKGYQENSLALEQIKLGYQVTIICTDDLTLWAASNDDRELILKKDKIFSEHTKIKIIRLRKLFKISGRIFCFGLGKKIKEENPQILFLHGVSLPMTIFGLLSINKKFGKNTKIIIDDHMVAGGSFNQYSTPLHSIFKPIFQLILKFSKANIVKWVAVSNETKEFMLKNYGINEEIEVIPLGFNSDTCYYDPQGAEEWRIANNLPANYKYVLYIGKCDNYKRPIDLLLPFKNFIELNENFALVIVGEMSPAYSLLITQKIASLGISDKVYIRPPVKNIDIRKVFSFAYMAIWPHGSSMAMLEAMVCNCPIIAPDIDVNLERLSDLRGLLFKNVDIDLLIQMHNVSKLREQIVGNASNWVNQYSWENINKDFLVNIT